MLRLSRLVLSSLLGLPLAVGACVESDGDGDDGADGTGDGDGDGDGDGADGADGSPADGGDDGADDGTPGPSQADVAQCRETCDRLLTFDCLDADSHETCYAICPERGADEIAQFQSCTDGTLPGCEGCWENFLDADPVPSDDGADDDGVDDGVGTATCEDACEEWLGAGCPAFGEYDSCAGFCASIPEAAHDLVVECVDNRDGCTLPESCTFEEGGSKGGG